MLFLLKLARNILASFNKGFKISSIYYMPKVKIQNIEEEIKEESESDNEAPEQVQEIETKTTPKQKMTSCPNCGKEMLQKTYRYYHSLKCKPHEKEVPQAIPKPEKIEVSFNIGRRAAKNETIKRLISRAF